MARRRYFTGLRLVLLELYKTLHFKVALTTPGNGIAFNTQRGSLALANATATTIFGNAQVSVMVAVTNAQQGWLTNITSGQAVICGGQGGGDVGTNFEQLSMQCNTGDVIEFTNVGTTGIGIINSYTNTIN